MMSEPNPEKPKIIVDEDWKSQVERERQQMRDQPQGAALQDTEPSEGRPLPPASFEFLVTSLGMQAMSALGQIPDPMSNELKVDVPLARLHIDLLELLQEKTQGNLTSDEATMIEDLLHQLRLVFVYVRDNRGR